MSYLEVSENSSRSAVVLSVRVQPRASRDEVSGTIEGALKIRLCAPAVENRALTVAGSSKTTNLS